MRIAVNAVRLQLHALACNLASFLHMLVRPARFAVFQFAEGALPRAVCAGILDMINGLRGPTTAGARWWPLRQNLGTRLTVAAAKPNTC